MDKHRTIPRTKFNYIEFVLRQERNKLRDLMQANVKNVRMEQGATKSNEKGEQKK